MFKKLTDEQIKSFTEYRSPSSEQLSRIAEAREATFNYLKTLNDIAKESPEKTRALNNVRDAMSLINFAISHEDD